MNKIKSAYFREGQHYSFFNLKEKFNLDAEKTHSRINFLKRYSVLKVVRREKMEYSDLSDQDIIIGDVPDDSSEFAYQFTFVGVILLDDIVVKCYPKYINSKDNKAVFDEFKIALKAVERYNQKEQLVHLYNGDAESKAFNQLAIALHILHEYFDNGLYSNQIEVLEQNGSGEILWDKTINETFAIIKNNTPYYLDYFTIDQTDNNQDYIRRLHSAIIAECSEMLKNCDALDLFDLQEADLPEQNIEDFGDTDYIKYRLEREIKNQFVTRKQNLLKTLYTYIAERKSNDSQNSVSLYGTNCMNLVWEKACGQIFGNEYETLKRHIPKPLWELDGNFDKNVETLIPDIVTRYNYPDGSELFYILDGKYYLPRITNNKISGNPGVQDVVKQFVYHKAFLDYIFSQYHCTVFNAFLFPMLSDSDETENIKLRGHVTMMDWGVETLVPLYLLFLRPFFVWEAYIKGKSCKDELNKVRSEVQFQDVFSGILDTSQTLQRKPKENVDNLLTMVGYLKQPYFDFIAGALSTLDSFLFYFYRTKDGLKYPIHPDLKHCQKFIGYTDDSRIIRGDISKNISVMDAEKLKVELGKVGFSGSAHSAEDYIVVEICNYKIDDSISVSELKESINAYKGNDATNAHSPKVIDVIN